MQEIKNLVDRASWPEGPWDSEPDLVVDPPLVCMRLGNGSWGALVGVSKELEERAILVQKAQKEFEGRRLELIKIDEGTIGHEHMEQDKLYIGFFCSAVGDTRPRELRYLMGIPEYIREHYNAAENYVTLNQIKAYGEQLTQFLRNKGLLPDTVNKSTESANV